MTEDRGLRRPELPLPQVGVRSSVLSPLASGSVTEPPARRADANASALRSGCVLAFDFGLKRIGVAVGEWETRTAHPIETIAEEANAARFARIGALIAEWRPVELVVGLPMTLEGEPHALTRRCQRFADQLAGRFGLPVTLVDERLTSVEAEAHLAEAGVRGRRVRAHLDSMAAQQILNDYFARA